MSKFNVSALFKTAQQTISRHSPEILTGIGIAGMITTTILAVKATPKAGETLKISLSVPEAKSNTSVTVTVNVETAAEKIVDVVYKKDGSVNAATLLADADAKKAEQNSAGNKQWTFEITAADETANGTYTVAALDSDGREEAAQITIDNFDFTPPARVTSIKG